MLIASTGIPLSAEEVIEKTKKTTDELFGKVIKPVLPMCDFR